MKTHIRQIVLTALFASILIFGGVLNAQAPKQTRGQVVDILTTTAKDHPRWFSSQVVKSLEGTTQGKQVLKDLAILCIQEQRRSKLQVSATELIASRALVLTTTGTIMIETPAFKDVYDATALQREVGK